MDKQTATLWDKKQLNYWANRFTWHFTADHAMTKWHYYMTKNGWNPNAPLNRNDLEFIGEVNNRGNMSNTNPTHTINIPSNRLGVSCHFSSLDVADTDNAFYNVIDVNVQIGNALTDLEKQLKNKGSSCRCSLYFLYSFHPIDPNNQIDDNSDESLMGDNSIFLHAHRYVALPHAS